MGWGIAEMAIPNTVVEEELLSMVQKVQLWLTVVVMNCMV